MTTKRLPEYRRDQLTGLIQRMEANGEGEDTIRFVVEDFKNKYAKSFGETVVESTKEAITTPVLPLAAAAGVPGSSQSLRLALAPQPGMFGLTVPFQAAGEGLGRAVRGATERLQETGGRASEAISQSSIGQKFPNMVSPVAAGVEMATDVAGGAVKAYSDTLTPQGLATELGSDVATFGIGKGLGAIGKGIKTVAAGAHIPSTAPKGSIKRVVENPELATPGYFRDKVDLFTEAILSGWGKVKKSAKELSNKKLKLFGNRPVMDPVDLRSTMAIKNLPKTVMDDPKLMGELDGIYDAIDSASKTSKAYTKVPRSVSGIPGEPVTKQAGVTIKELDAVKSKMESYISENIGDPNKKSLVDAVIGAKKAITAAEEAAKGAAGKTAKAARDAHSQLYKMSEEVKQVVGLPKDADPTDAATKTKVVAWFRNSIKNGDTETLKVLDNLSPGASTLAKKLAAVQSDPFAWTALSSLLPSLGLGSAGYLAKNPESGAKAAAVLVALSLIASPTVASRIIRTGGVRSLPIGAAAVGGPLMRFPGMINSGEEK